jgi:IS30 family transposase
MVQQITFEERVRIEELLVEKYSPAEIAKALRREPSSIGRELQRNRIGGVYSAMMAQALTKQRRCQRPLTRRMERPEIRDAVENGLIQAWSPDEISGRQRLRLPQQSEQHISASTIYRWIARQSRLRTHWQRFLRRRGRARWVPRKPAKRPGKPLRDRPRGIEKRGRLGDFEGDLVLGSPGSGGILTMVCRKSRYLRVTKVRNKTARHVHGKFKGVLSTLPPNKRHSTTFDNGSELPAVTSCRNRTARSYTLPIRGVRTSVVRTKTPTAYYVNSSPKGPTSQLSPHKNWGASKP